MPLIKWQLYRLQEKECNAKFMQYASGVNMYIFWGVSILWDILSNVVTIIIIIFMLALSQQSEWKSFSDLAIVFLILFLYNFAMIPIMCVFSLFFTKPSLGKTFVIVFNLVGGMYTKFIHLKYILLSI